MSAPRKVAPHGTRTMYRRGCRCTKCKAAENEYRTARRPSASSRFVARRTRPTIAPDADVVRCREERAKRQRRDAARLAAVIADAKAQLARETSHALTVGRSGRPRKSSHIPCLSEAA